MNAFIVHSSKDKVKVQILLDEIAEKTRSFNPLMLHHPHCFGSLYLFTARTEAGLRGAIRIISSQDEIWGIMEQSCMSKDYSILEEQRTI